MTTRGLARAGALAGVLFVIVTFIGMGIVKLPPTASGLRSYIASANAFQTGIGNFVELFGSLLFLVFAAFLYSTVREADAARRSWPALSALVGATVYVAVTAVAIAAQQAIVEWGKAGADPNATLGLYIFDESSYTLGSEFGALFLAGIGVALLSRRGAWRVLAVGALAVAIVLFAGGLVSAASPANPMAIIGSVLFLLWTLVAGVYLIFRPGPSSTRL